MTRGQIIRHNGWQTIVSLDQALHCLGGLLAALLLGCVPGSVRPVVLPVVWADETLSSRCWRWRLDGVRSWPCRLVDGLFWWDRERRGAVVVRHCELSWESERDGRQLPPELRQEGTHGEGSGKPSAGA